MAEGTGKGGKIVGIAKKRARRVQEKVSRGRRSVSRSRNLALANTEGSNYVY